MKLISRKNTNASQKYGRRRFVNSVRIKKYDKKILVFAAYISVIGLTLVQPFLKVFSPI